MAVVLALVPMLAHAMDVSAGAVEVGGTSHLGFSSTSTKYADGRSSTDTSYNVLATVLNYVTPHLGVGVAGGYNHDRMSSGSASASSWSVSGGPAVGFLYPLDEKLSLALQGDVFFSHSSFSWTTASGKGFGFDLGAGLKYFLARSFSFDGSVRYSYAKQTSFGLTGVGSLDIRNSGLGVDVGLSVYFGN